MIDIKDITKIKGTFLGAYVLEDMYKNVWSIESEFGKLMFLDDLIAFVRVKNNKAIVYELKTGNQTEILQKLTFEMVNLFGSDFAENYTKLIKIILKLLKQQFTYEKKSYNHKDIKNMIFGYSYVAYPKG